MVLLVHSCAFVNSAAWPSVWPARARPKIPVYANGELWTNVSYSTTSSSKGYGRIVALLQIQITFRDVDDDIPYEEAMESADAVENQVLDKLSSYWVVLQECRLAGNRHAEDPVTGKTIEGVRYKTLFPFTWLELIPENLITIPFAHVQGPVNAVPDFSRPGGRFMYILPLLP